MLNCFGITSSEATPQAARPWSKLANERLEEFFSQAWNQSNISVRFKSVGNRLEVWLKELGARRAWVPIEERSDGLRTFVALSAFLASQRLQIPPVLLIDEAENHLHYDAQADLVGDLAEAGQRNAGLLHHALPGLSAHGPRHRHPPSPEEPRSGDVQPDQPGFLDQ